MKTTIYGDWTILKVEGIINGTKRVKCKCVCGNIKSVNFQMIKQGKSKSCGCMKNQEKRKPVEGVSTRKHPLYVTWCGMKARCYNENSDQYKNYGGREIKVCEAWKTSFLQFVEDMGKRPSKKHSLNRINNDGNYEPSNCTWSTQRVQMNNMQKNRWITSNGITLTLAQWSQKTGLSSPRILARLKSGKTIFSRLASRKGLFNGRRLKSQPVKSFAILA